MKTFTYTHHQGSEGKMVEKAAKDYDFFVDGKLAEYIAQNFSPSDNGKTFGEDEFEVKLQKRASTTSEWKDCTASEPKHPALFYRQIAVPLSEKREERMFTLEEIRRAICTAWFEAKDGELDVKQMEEKVFRELLNK